MAKIICPVCKQRVGLNKNGTIVAHDSKKTFFTILCEASRRLPEQMKTKEEQ